MVKVTGIQLSDTGRIIVDDQLQTNLPDIYAIGDIIETTSVVTGQPIQSMLSSVANRQGHMLADILNGTPIAIADILVQVSQKFGSYSKLCGNDRTCIKSIRHNKL